MTTIPSNGEKRWQCVSGFQDATASALAASVADARSILNSTITICRVMPVGLNSEAAARVVHPYGYDKFQRWELATAAAAGAVTAN
jgi:hypothetical protein